MDLTFDYNKASKLIKKIRAGVSPAIHIASMAVASATHAFNEAHDTAGRHAGVFYEAQLIPTLKALEEQLTPSPPLRFWDDDSHRRAFQNAAKRKRISRKFHPYELGTDAEPKKRKFPDNWERLNFEVDGQAIPCIHAHAKDPKVLNVFVTGLKSTTPYYREKIRILNAIGISTLVINLPDPGKTIDFLDHYRNIFRDAITTPGSIVEQAAGHLPVMLWTHSTGGLLLSEALSERKQAEHIANNFIGATMLSPFFTAAHRQNPVKKYSYAAYSWLYANTEYGENLVDQWHARAIGEPDIKSSVASSTHGQNSYMVENGEAFLEHIRQNGFPKVAQDFPITMILGSRDFIACPEKATEVGNLMNADVHTIQEIWHNPLLESAEVQKLLVTDTLEKAKVAPHMRNPIPISRRLGFSLESSTRFLDPATSFG